MDGAWVGPGKFTNWVSGGWVLGIFGPVHKMAFDL